jgi:hypothetical protein
MVAIAGDGVAPAEGFHYGKILPLIESVHNKTDIAAGREVIGILRESDFGTGTA